MKNAFVDIGEYGDNYYNRFAYRGGNRNYYCNSERQEKRKMLMRGKLRTLSDERLLSQRIRKDLV